MVRHEFAFGEGVVKLLRGEPDGLVTVRDMTQDREESSDLRDRNDLDAP